MENTDKNTITFGGDPTHLIINKNFVAQSLTASQVTTVEWLNVSLFRFCREPKITLTIVMKAEAAEDIKIVFPNAGKDIIDFKANAQKCGMRLRNVRSLTGYGIESHITNFELGTMHEIETLISLPPGVKL